MVKLGFALRHRTLAIKGLTLPARDMGGSRSPASPNMYDFLRQIPRVLLSDEVGFTIEACLIIQRMRASGRAERVFSCPNLVHQWFVELLRRFNLWFNIYGEERCRAVDGDEESVS